MDARRRLTTAAALALLIVVAPACGDDAPTEPGQGDASVTGAVTFVKTGAGVEGLVVALLSGSRVMRTTHTDANGLFTLENVTAGDYTARLTGFDLTGLNLNATAFDPLQQSVTVDGGSADLAFAAVGLVPPRVTGDVTCDGSAVEGARVRVIGGLDTDVVATTDVRGRYAVNNLVAGTYAVVPVEAPCTLSPPIAAVSIQQGQAGEVDLEG
jgi:uncharacterized surface anchored protein